MRFDMLVPQYRYDAMTPNERDQYVKFIYGPGTVRHALPPETVQAALRRAENIEGHFEVLTGARANTLGHAVPAPVTIEGLDMMVQMGASMLARATIDRAMED